MSSSHYQSGFTLAELAVVLVIVGLLLGGLFVPLSAQMDSRNVNETQKTLNDIRDALLGFASANGRLPCPAAAAAVSGTEAFVGAVGASACSSPATGFVPGVTLGVGPTNQQGIVIDAWGNPIRYAVTTSNGNAFTTNTGMRTQTMAVLAPDLHVCSTSTGATATTCAPQTDLVSTAIAVVFSTGNGGAAAGRSNDENANLDGDSVFVSHTQSTAAGAEFDDMVIWLSPNTLYNRMITAGQLP